MIENCLHVYDLPNTLNIHKKGGESGTQNHVGDALVVVLNFGVARTRGYKVPGQG